MRGPLPLAVTLMFFVGVVTAHPCDERSARFVELTTTDAELWKPLAEQLTAELRRRAIIVCPRDTSRGTKLSRVEIQLDARQDEAEVLVNDEVTHKQLTRSVALPGLAGEARLLALAIAIDELLGASWSELALRPASTPTPAQKIVTPIVEQAVALHVKPPTRVRRLDLGILAQAEVDRHLVARVGGSVGVQFWPKRALGLRAETGWLHGPRIALPDGHAQVDAVELALRLLWRPRADSGLLRPILGAGLRADRLFLRGFPVPQASGQSAWATAGYGQITGQLGYRMSESLLTGVELGAAWPLWLPQLRDGSTLRPIVRAPLFSCSLSFWWSE